MQHSQARERVLQAAEQLFAERGYVAVTVKDIAKAAGIHHASLYHHAPDGKEGLFMEVMERVLSHHEQGIAAAIASGATLRDQLRGIAAWLLSQAPIDLIRMAHSDGPALKPDAHYRLTDRAYRAILIPIEQVIERGQAGGAVRAVNIGNIAGAWFWAIEGLHSAPEEFLVQSRQAMADEIIDVFLAGLA